MHNRVVPADTIEMTLLLTLLAIKRTIVRMIINMPTIVRMLTKSLEFIP